jgi:SAM-dependent methyltransferase
MKRGETRNQILMRGLSKDMLGIEVAPWLWPIAPKAKGYNVRVIDVFDRATLLARAKDDSNISGWDMSQMEDVDFVGSATEIAGLVPQDLHGKFDYVISSHNFEHLPNPIKFLQGCASVLRDGGSLVMVVPDRRACFDFYRSNTGIGEWLDAFAEDRQRPSRRQSFDEHSQSVGLNIDGKRQGSFFLHAPIDQISLSADFVATYQQWYERPKDNEYHDTHCSVMTPASLELLIVEARQLGLSAFVVDDVSGTSGCEFTIRLRLMLTGRVPSAEEFAKRRNSLKLAALREYAVQTEALPMRVRIRSRLRSTARVIRSFGRRVRGKPDS